ncbi:hypothetical protein LLH00_14050 [bacterium]|nr:hypothetical protein [bacterium]
MLQKRFLILTPALAAMLACLASTAFAEVKSSYTANGNNVGLVVGTNQYGGPLVSDVHQYPAGSGNFYAVGRWNWGVHVIRDADGNGTVEDTACILSRGGRVVGCVSSLEQIDLITSLATAGEKMDEATARLENNRLFVSSDAEDLAVWPAEFREGRSTGGAPILHGALTIASRFGDTFGIPGVGQSVEYQFYFLNFAESNNMVYMHVFFRNMSEYLKWSPNPDIVAKVANTPDGQTWVGAIQYYCTANGFFVGGEDEAWAYYFPKQIIVQADRNGVESSFSGNPAAMAYYQMRNPQHGEDEIRLTNTCALGWNGAEYGFYPEEPMASGYSMGRSYRYAQGRWAATGEFYAPSISPFTGKPLDGWPGVLLPDDSRYRQWIWGEQNAMNSYNYWGEMHNVTPRDSFSLDAAIMFTYLDPPNFSFPSSQDINNIDDQSVQTALNPILDMANVAEVVYNGHFVLPETPASPPLTIIPGDRQVTLTWSDINLHTPDAYYAFLQNNPELDPDHLYREFDFEGFRLYRSFVGPSDSHSELIWQGSLSQNNVNFFYVDVYSDDEPLYRMRNGMKVWYALVPYDRNYDPSTGTEFSLPDPSSGKQWNRPGNGLYVILPRSDASNFKGADMQSITFNPLSGTPETEGTVILAGDGDGNLTEAPKVLAPAIGNLIFQPVNSERITSALNLSLRCTGADAYDKSCAGRIMAGQRSIQLIDGSYQSPTMTLLGGGDDNQRFTFNGPVDADGINYALDVTFTGLANTNTVGDPLYHQLDAGGYTGADIGLWTGRWCGEDTEPGSLPSNIAFTRSGQFRVTWQDAGSGMLTVDVQDLTRGAAFQHVKFMDETGWGFQTVEGFGGGFTSGSEGNYITETFIDRAPRSERQYQMTDKIAVDNTEEFGFWIDGLTWVVRSESGLTMPAPGTVWTVTVAFGTWNDDMTEFTQYPDLPQVGDSWSVVVNPSSLKAEDADLSKIRVVPNPYLASSFLDLSPSSRRIEFINLPDLCTIRIYSLGGHLVNVLNHIGSNRYGWGDYKDWDRLDISNNPKEFSGYDNHSGTEPWNMRNRFGQTVASGLYFYLVTDSRGKSYTGRFYIVN